MKGAIIRIAEIRVHSFIYSPEKFGNLTSQLLSSFLSMLRTFVMNKPLFTSSNSKLILDDLIVWDRSKKQH